MKINLAIRVFSLSILFAALLSADSNILQFDDDAFASKDDYHYTGGMFYGYMFDSDKSPINPSFLKDYKNTNAISFTYMVFTPKNKRSSTVILNDIPYAGYAKLNFLDYKYTKKEFYKIAVNIGAVGPMVKARQNQSNIHHLLGYSIPSGWDNQLKDHLFYGFSIAYGNKTHQGTLKNYKWDWCNYAEGNAGSFYSSLFFSTVFRFGKNLPETFDTISSLSTASTNELLNFNPNKSLNWYITAGAFANKVGNFYIINKAIDLGYQLSKIDYTYGLQISFNVLYKHIKYSFKIKTTSIHAKDNFPFQNASWGGISATWKF